MSKLKTIFTTILTCSVSAAVTLGGLGISAHADETGSDIELKFETGNELNSEFSL